MAGRATPTIDLEKIVNVATVQHRSPFRYPGGKTWLVPTIRHWLRSLRPRATELAEPFAGGAIVGLSALFEDLVEKLVLVEKDEDVGAVWRVLIYGEGLRLGEQITSFELTTESVTKVLNGKRTNDFQRAFATILRNRVQRGGILAPGASLLNKGENGRGIKSRWYPDTLNERMKAIVSRKACIDFVAGDGIEFMRYNCFRDNSVFFIDPPYTVAGRRLYKYSDIDHEELFRVTASIKGDFLMTYDNAPGIVNLAKKFGFETALVPMKNTHHEVMNELLVGKDLEWLRQSTCC
jgi:DNA adenine methylase